MKKINPLNEYLYFKKIVFNSSRRMNNYICFFLSILLKQINLLNKYLYLKKLVSNFDPRYPSHKNMSHSAFCPMWLPLLSHLAEVCQRIFPSTLSTIFHLVGSPCLSLLQTCTYKKLEKENTSTAPSAKAQVFHSIHLNFRSWQLTAVSGQTTYP